MDWHKIRKEYETTDITAKKLADKYNVPTSTLHDRKKRENWKRKKKLKKATDKVGGQYGNDNAAGYGAPEGNKNAVSHGLYANYLSDEANKIIYELSKMSPADQLWYNILIQYTAIIRAQKNMFVRDEFADINNNISISVDPRNSSKDNTPLTIGERREWHMAYERQERFMNAQSRAIDSLSSLIKHFVELADQQEERKLKLKTLNTQILKMEAETEIAQSSLDTDGKSIDLLEILHELVRSANQS